MLMFERMALLQADPAAVACIERHAGAGLQYRWAWLRNFAATVNTPGQQAVLYVLRQGGRVRVALPVLEREATWPRARELEALSNYYSAVWAPAIDDDVDEALLARFFSRLLRQPGAAGALLLRPMAGDHPALARCEAALRHCGWITQRDTAFGNWYLRTAGHLCPEYLAGHSGTLRNTLKRMGAKFAAEGGRLEIITGGEDAVRRGMLAYAQVYGRSWKVPEPHVNFMPELARISARQGWLRLGLAWVGEQPVAAQLWMVGPAAGERRAEIFKLAYDEAFGRLSVGSLLTGALMQHVLEVDRVDEVDYLIGDDAYKRQWVNQRRERVGLEAWNPATALGLARLARARAGWAWRQIRQVHQVRQNEPADAIAKAPSAAVAKPAAAGPQHPAAV
jgi:CelD/BcsL family acetyltransferase involved in cellulose biosynthesis